MQNVVKKLNNGMGNDLLLNAEMVLRLFVDFVWVVNG